MVQDLREFDIVITHHGVKGQKWGVRRSLTSTGHIVGSKYGSDKPVTNRRIRKAEKNLEKAKKTGELAEKRKQETAKKTTPLGTAIDNLAVKQKRVKELQERANKQVDNRANNDTKVKGNIEKELWKAMAEQYEAEDAVVKILQSIAGV